MPGYSNACAGDYSCARHLPSLRNLTGAAGGLVAALGLSAALAHLTRGAGRRLETRLYALWDGKPSMAMLRHRDERINPVTKRRYHDFLRSVGKLIIPTPEKENQDRTAADKFYDLASDWLRRRARSNRDFPLVHAENIGYGFSRNLLALTPFGTVLAATCVVGEFALLVQGHLAGQDLPPETAIAVFISAAMTLVWLILIRPSWVKWHAEGYARALLEICDERTPGASRGT